MQDEGEDNLDQFYLFGGMGINSQDEVNPVNKINMVNMVNMVNNNSNFSLKLDLCVWLFLFDINYNI